MENREIHEVYARRKIKFIKYEAVATSCDCLVFVFPILSRLAATVPPNLGETLN